MAVNNNDNGNNVNDSHNTNNNTNNNLNTNNSNMIIVWSSVTKLLTVHLLAVYGLYCWLLTARYQTILWTYSLGVCSSFGILCGAHRLWSHRSYKARLPLRVLLMLLNTLALQNTIYDWCRDHRGHHKFSETDADPHNSRRGFFFSHMGWLMVRKHQLVVEKGRTLQLQDLSADPVVRFQRRYYLPLVILVWGLVPTLLPWYMWSESLAIAFSVNMTRYVMSLHHTWLVNSLAHMSGYRPYDKYIASRENQSVVYLTLGEGYHNYHHTFPFDYSASELGWKSNFNLATAFIDMFAYMGQAYDRKQAPIESIENRKLRTAAATDLIDDLNNHHNNIPVPNNTINNNSNNMYGYASTVYDYLMGILVVTWPLWLTFTIRLFI
ncbi:stearoyl-CoA desaturase 5-like [Oppia nitens]|uniref:stearoyl-CoA desaturase 5-like n=1 Tax=Oppia nitens TaxID=1686743 RepID=UPI0023DA1C06|nr:stearoyl-CoA desaturase 5-like [Oppia nitens]